jgi:type IV secretion system protein VirB10
MKSFLSLFAASRSDPDPPVAGEGSSSPAEQFQRSSAAVAGGRSPHAQLHSTIGLVLIGTVGFGLLAWYYSTAFSRASEARSATQKATATKADAESVLPPLGVPKPTKPPLYRIGSVLGDPTLEATTPNPSVIPAAYTAPRNTPPPKTPEQLKQDRELAGSVFTRPNNPSNQSARTEVLDSDEGVVDRAPAARGSDDRLAALLTTQPVATVHASMLPTRRLLLPKGSFIDCTLETAMDSSLPGLITCLTAVDTFGADGTVVLLERGTKLIGETRGEVAQGASRIFVLWSEARTPTGVVMPLASPGTDELGRSGLPGKVRRHFWDRFGAAILVSMIDGAVQGVANNQSRGNSSITVNPNGTRDVTTEILRSTVNIPPTVVKRQGDRIQILVARDLDFRSVYELHAR